MFLMLAALSVVGPTVTVESRAPVAVVLDVGVDRGATCPTVRTLSVRNGKATLDVDYRDHFAVMLGEGATREVAETNIVEVVSTSRPAAAPRFTAASTGPTGPRLTVEVDPFAGSSLAIEGKTELSDAAWKPASREHRFFRAVQR